MKDQESEKEDQIKKLNEQIEELKQAKPVEKEEPAEDTKLQEELTELKSQLKQSQEEESRLKDKVKDLEQKLDEAVGGTDIDDIDDKDVSDGDDISVTTDQTQKRLIETEKELRKAKETINTQGKQIEEYQSSPQKAAAAQEDEPKEPDFKKKEENKEQDANVA